MTTTLRFHSKKPKRAHPEGRLQSTIVQHLRMIPMPGVLAHSIPNEAKRSKLALFALCRMGMRPGAADLCISINGRTHYMEVKAKGEKQSPEQIAFEADCVLANCPYVVVDNIDDALRVLTAWGAIRMTARRAA